MSRSISFPRSSALCLLILGGFIPAVGTLRADTVYTNFGTGDTYAAEAGLIVTNDGAAWSSVAVSFMPTENYYLNSIEFVATDIIPDDLGTTIAIFADNGQGQPGGAPLESFTVGGPLGEFGSAVPVLTVTSVLQPLLQADQLYWVGMQGPADGFIIWNQNTTLADGFSQTDGSGNWSTSDADQGVLEVDGTLAPASVVPPPPQPTDPSLGSDSDDIAPVGVTTFMVLPEPGAWWLMFGGLLAIVYFARRQATRALALRETTNR